MTEIFVVRHGETVENSQRICQGQTEGTLTNNGISQAKAVAKQLSQFKFRAIYTSPLKRARLTSDIIKKQQADIPIFELNQLMERNMGEMEGRKFPDNFDYTAPIKNAESLTDMFNRVVESLKYIAQNHPNQQVAIVTHGITIRMIKCYIQNIPLDRLNEIELQGNGTYFRIQID
ncbi:MAG: histidine phosphatase family protein [Bacteroidales bacterium]